MTEEPEQPVLLIPEIFDENYKPDQEVYSLMCVFASLSVFSVSMY